MATVAGWPVYTFIQDQQPRLVDQYARDLQSLPLSRRQADAVFSGGRVGFVGAEGSADRE